MATKIFSKRNSDAAKGVYLKPTVRQRIWYILEEFDPLYNPNGFNNDWTLCWDGLTDKLKKEHGWQELRAYKSQTEWEQVNAKDFILKGVPRFVLDATEIFYDLLAEQRSGTKANPTDYQRKLNGVFEDDNLPWRMLDGRIIKLDSQWVEQEIIRKAHELLSSSGFDGALREFLEARMDLTSGDTKGAIHSANLAFESTIKSILNVDQAKPGALIRKLIDNGLVPDYYEGFLKVFEENILRSVAIARNFEKGVGHGQGATINDPPKSLAELAVNLAGVLILYLMQRYLELHPPADKSIQESAKANVDDIPF